MHITVFFRDRGPETFRNIKDRTNPHNGCIGLIFKQPNKEGLLEVLINLEEMLYMEVSQFKKEVSESGE